MTQCFLELNSRKISSSGLAAGQHSAEPSVEGEVVGGQWGLTLRMGVPETIKSKGCLRCVLRTTQLTPSRSPSG